MTKLPHYLKTIKKLAVYGFIGVFLLATAGYLYLYVLPKGPELTEVGPLNTGLDSFVTYAYKDSKRKSIRVWTYKPEKWVENDKIVFVMHGGGRNAKDYVDAWVGLANDYNLFVIAPEFENSLAKYTTNDYQEGNLFTFFGTSNPKEEWAFQAVENIFDHVKNTNSISNRGYDIFGHSAGGQFVHRMVLLYPEARIETAIAANAGLYTFPDKSLRYPYGTKNIDLGHDKLKMSFEKRLILLTGEMDNSPDLGTFSTSELAMNQGSNRLERGGRFYEFAREFAAKNEMHFAWQVDTVRNVGHDYQKMSENSIRWIMDLR